MTRLCKLAWFCYVALAVLIDTRRNSIIGGGGGLAFIAGISSVYAVPAYPHTIALAVLLVLLIVFMSGI